MRILMISAFFPPFVYGGFEIRVGDIADELSLLGHNLLIVTTRPDPSLKDDGRKFSYPVFRLLTNSKMKINIIDKLTSHKYVKPMGLLISVLNELIQDMNDLRIIDNAIKVHKPDVIYLGHLRPLSKALMPFLADLQIPLVADEGGRGLVALFQEKGTWFRFIQDYWSGNPFSRSAKKIVMKVVSKLSNQRIKLCWCWPRQLSVFFNSYLNQKNAQEACLPVARQTVIHSGLVLSEFPYVTKHKINNPVKILIPGRLEPVKGQMESLELAEALLEERIEAEVTIVGGVWNSTYYQDIKDQINQRSLGKHVFIIPPVSRMQLAKLYEDSDLCFFMSRHKTGFSRVVLESMASGCVLISYGLEGSDEILRDHENGFIVGSGDILSVVDVIKKLIAEPVLFSKVRENARKEIEKYFAMDAYVNKIEDFLNLCKDTAGTKKFDLRANTFFSDDPGLHD